MLQADGEIGNDVNRTDIDEIERKYPLHTVFVHNIPYEMKPDDLESYAAGLGEISSFFPLIGKKGICFVSYYDIRKAQAAKDAFNKYTYMGRTMEATYAYKPEFDSRRDLSKMCSALTVEGTTPIDPEIAKQKFAEFGELRDFEIESQTKLTVKYYDSRLAAKVMSTPISFGAENVKIEYQPDKDLTGILPSRARPRHQYRKPGFSDNPYPRERDDRSYRYGNDRRGRRDRYGPPDYNNNPYGGQRYPQYPPNAYQGYPPPGQYPPPPQDQYQYAPYPQYPTQQQQPQQQQQQQYPPNYQYPPYNPYQMEGYPQQLPQQQPPQQQGQPGYQPLNTAQQPYQNMIQPNAIQPPMQPPGQSNSIANALDELAKRYQN